MIVDFDFVVENQNNPKVMISETEFDPYQLPMLLIVSGWLVIANKLKEMTDPWSMLALTGITKVLDMMNDAELIRAQAAIGNRKILQMLIALREVK